MTSTPPATSTSPPLLIYLPGLPDRPQNSAWRVAEILAHEADAGPGTFVAQRLQSEYESLNDGGKIVRGGGDAVLEVLALDYRTTLLIPEAGRTGLRALVRELLLSLRYLLWAGLLILRARRNAKSGMAKLQIVIGMLSTLVLLLFFAATLLAVLVALGLVENPVGAETAADAVALGLTATATWLFVRVRPAIMRTGVLVQQLMDFVHSARREGSVANKLSSAIDEVLESSPERAVYILGYSLGSLVAIAFAFPRASLGTSLDHRHAAALRGLFTIGCPADFVRLYLPDYLSERVPRVKDLPWTNIYIAADVMGSNFVDGDDAISDHDVDNPRAPMAMPHPTSTKYTEETLTWLNVFSRRGFLSHGGYWDDVSNDSCLRLVLNALPHLGAQTLTQATASLSTKP